MHVLIVFASGVSDKSIDHQVHAAAESAQHQARNGTHDEPNEERQVVSAPQQAVYPVRPVQTTTLTAIHFA